MIRFPCSCCFQQLTVPPEHAGRLVRCNGCGTANRAPGQAVPLPETAIAHGPESTATPPCPQCGSAIRKDAVLCLNCGFDRQAGRTATTEVSDLQPSDTAPRQLRAWIFTACAVLSAAAIWAMVAILAGRPLGFLALAIGATSGFAVRRVFAKPVSKSRYIATGFCAFGLIAGKILTLTWGTPSIAVADIVADPFAMRFAVGAHMRHHGTFPRELQKRLDDDPQEPRTYGERKSVEAEVQRAVQAQLEAMTSSEKRAAARWLLDSTPHQIPHAGRSPAQISVWDIAWFGLALWLAYRFGSARS